VSSPLDRARWLIFALWLAALGSPPAVLAQREAERLSESFRAASKRVLPAVVTVRPIGVPSPFDTATPRVLTPFGSDTGTRLEPRDPSGSGFVFDAARGLVLTNDHVIQNAARVVVILANGRERPVKRVDRDPKSDLAVLWVDPAGLAQAEWGNEGALDTGDWVLAVGQPFGLSGTVTAGIVSGKGRGIGLALYEDLIQTDAAINPGNSGGPLVNLNGEVIGINTAIKTVGGGYEGVGFAVPASRARRVASDLAEFGRVRRAYLGVTIRPVDPVTAERLGAASAALISSVGVASPASAAGIQPGDVILRVEGRPVDGPGQLQALIEVAPVGQPLTLTIDRGGQVADRQVRPEPQPERFAGISPLPGPMTAVPTPGVEINVPGFRLSVPPSGGAPMPGAAGEPALTPVPNSSSDVPPTIRSRPAVPTPDSAPGSAQETSSRSPTRFRELGLRLEEPSPNLVRRFRFDREPQGLIVTGVEPDGPADRGGLEVGMVITDAASRKVTTLAEFREAVSGRPPGRDLLIRILKGTKAEFRVIVDRPAASGADPALDPLPGLDSPRLDPIPPGPTSPPSSSSPPAGKPG
jgi:serine protease Do